MGSTGQSARAASGLHLIADFWGVRTIDSVAELERLVRAAVEAAGATLLDIAFHQFPDHGGITGYALLAESHLSVHTWPERDHVAIDVFMCGQQRPETSLEVFRQAFRPSAESVHSVRRGIPADAAAVPTAVAASAVASTAPAIRAGEV